MFSVSEAAQILLQARINKKPIGHLPECCCPENIDDAYNCQKELTHLMLKTFGGRTVGYKIGCTNQTAQNLLTVDGPFYGPLISPFVYESPAKLTFRDYFMRVIEPEFAFQMAHDLPAREQKYTGEEVSEAVASVVPAIEVVDSRYQDWTENNSLSLIADNACNAAWIHGKPNPEWTTFDLANHSVDLIVNGMAVRKGSGYLPMNNPLNALTWLTNVLSNQGKGLSAGDWVSTGTTCEVYLAKLGDRIVADFGQIGSVELNFIS